MGSLIRRKSTVPRRTGLTTEKLWHTEDGGIIVSWEVGRDRAKSEADLAARAKRGELPLLGWKGGVEHELKKAQKYGTYRYLAMWQGLRNDDLNIDPAIETEIICARTGVTVIFTSDASKYSTP